MCGIVGMCTRQDGDVHLPDSLASITHRGPAGRGEYQDERNGLVLGHVRLAIIDLSTAGAQPMASDDGPVVLALNGEIYNFWELRAGLVARGIAFRHHADREALLRLYLADRLEMLQTRQVVSYHVIAARQITGAAIRKRARASVVKVKRSNKLNQSTRATSSGLPSGARFHEEIAAGWSAGYARSGFARRLDLFRPILKRYVQPGDSWVDLGCGSGVLSKELLALGATVVAVDGSPRMLSHAREQMGSQYAGRVNWIQSDVQSIDALKNGAFDGVLCSSVVEYLDRPDALLKEVARILSPGGVLVISLPPTLSAVRVFQKGIRAFMTMFGKDKFTYLSVSRLEISPRAINRLLQEAGLSVIRSTRFDPVLPRALLRLVRPSLLVVEARKQDRP
jgi:ubiquinone/menaquinone biosynthesis C-methylase UbiE